MMNKKLIAFGVAAFVGLCAANTLIALRQALQEKKAREAAAAQDAEPEAAAEPKPEAAEA